MKRFSIAIISLVALISFSCTDNDQTASSPLEPDPLGDSHDFVSICRANMRSISSQQVLYFAVHERYATTLEQLELSGLQCPECGLEYLLEADAYSFNVYCPLPEEPTHGSVIDGVASWPPGESEEWFCRNNMYAITYACILFFTENERYPETLEELGITSLTCPSCNEPYFYDSSAEDDMYVGCPCLPEPGHGFIDSGVASWTPYPPDLQTICRSNMAVIASQEVIYYATNENYTENLEDLGLGGLACPECGALYTIRVGGEGDYLFIECGKPSEPNHGNIDNGVASW